ncbi:MAG: hypothetical protein U0802_13745 [Candidatus Binatia bacterium]
MRVTVEQGDALIRFTESGGIEVDYSADGSIDDTFRSCTSTPSSRSAARPGKRPAAHPAPPARHSTASP